MAVWLVFKFTLSVNWPEIEKKENTVISQEITNRTRSFKACSILPVDFFWYLLSERERKNSSDSLLKTTHSIFEIAPPR